MLSLAIIDGLKASSCVNSGYCCKQRPCPFGEVEDKYCKHLKEISDNRYICNIAEWIMTQPGWEVSPAFGAGCSSTLFNADRERIIRQIKNKEANIKSKEN